MSNTPWSVLGSAAGALVILWLLLVLALWLRRPAEASLRETLRLLPDLVRLLGRLARAPEVPRGVRVRLALTVGYLALPVDLVPDFIPVLGVADDAVVVALALRSVVRRAGTDAVRRHWPGSEQGLDAVLRLCGTRDPLPGSRSPGP